MNSPRTVLVVGASGFVGGTVLHELAAQGLRAIGMSRRRPASLPSAAAHLEVDLLDRDSLRAVVANAGAGLAAVTDVVYAAVNETPGDLVASWTDPDHARRNGRMLENLLDSLGDIAGGLRRVLLVHGTKAYGVTLPGHHLAVPLRESLPRPPIDDFYFRQEDCLWSRQAASGSRWSWTVLRAPMIAGGGAGSNLNALLAIGVYASLCKAAGEPLCFPGRGPSDGVMEMVDVELLARAVVWSLQSRAADNQCFNVANGDVYVWPDLWPSIADVIGVLPGDPQPCSIERYVAAHAGQWAALVHHHRLAAPADWKQFLGESCALADFALNNCERSVLTSTIRIRQAGFADCVDTAASVAKWILRWQQQALLPPP